MLPYYSCPFVNYNRNSMNMPMPMPETLAPVTFQFMQPSAQPMMQPMTQPGAQPIMQPLIPSTQPMVPYIGQVEPTYFQEQYPMLENTELLEGMDAESILPSSTGLSDPPPIVSNNPPTTRIVLFKELTGYPNYGNPSGNADILYTGNRAAWTFNVPANLIAGGTRTAQIIIRAVLDDHANVPVSRYSARITVNGNVVHTGRLPLEHGIPVGGRFTNWRELTFNVANIRRNNRVDIQNTSTAGVDDWIAFDWMELRISTR